ncbi:hypothetical protein Tco_0001624 [Tanacetum coccineum]
MGIQWVPIPYYRLPESGPSTALKILCLQLTEEKICKKNDVKARSLLLMALPNEHQLTFNQYADAQSMFIAIKARFGGNDATKKTQKALLKQQYENFPMLHMLRHLWTQSLNRLQKLVSRWQLSCVDTSLRRFKCTGNSKVNTASAETSTASFSDATAYAFLSSQPQGSQLVHEDLEQIHDDDLEEMDQSGIWLCLSMRARNSNHENWKEEVQEAKTIEVVNQGNSSQTDRIEDASEKAMCAIDGGGFDWSGQGVFNAVKSPQHVGVENHQTQLCIINLNNKLYCMHEADPRLFSKVSADGNHDDSSFQDDGIDDHQVNTTELPGHKFPSTTSYKNSQGSFQMIIAIYEEILTRTCIHAFLPASYLKKKQKQSFLKLISDTCMVEAMQENSYQFSYTMYGLHD